MRGWQEENPLGGAPGEDPRAWGAGQPTLGALGWDPTGSTWHSSRTRGPAGERGCSQPGLHPNAPEKAHLRAQVERRGHTSSGGLRHWLMEELQPRSEGPTPVPPCLQHSAHLPGSARGPPFRAKPRPRCGPSSSAASSPRSSRPYLGWAGVFLSFGRPLIARHPPG